MERYFYCQTAQVFRARNEDQLRVAQFVETLESGGAEKLAVDFANALALRGHESHLIVLREDGPFRERIEDGVNLEVLERRQVFGSLGHRLGQFRATYRQLSQIVGSHGIEVVQTHLPRANFLGLFLGRTNKIQVFPTIHNNREFDYGGDSPWYMDYARRRAYRQMLQWCQGMIAVSDQVKVGMAKELGIAELPVEDRIVVVPNGVVVPREMTAEDRQRVRAEYGTASDTVLIVAVGRLSRQKNFQSLVRALAVVAESLGSWRCIIAGEGDEREDIQSQIVSHGLQDNIELVGYVPDVESLLGAGDIFCLSSRFEGLPLVLLEAMAAGLPICSYAIDGVADVIENGREALLSEVENYQDLARTLLVLAKDGQKRRAMGQAAKSLIARSYSFEMTVDRLMEIYNGQD